MASELPSIDLEPAAAGLPGWFRCSLPLPEGDSRPETPWSLRTDPNGAASSLQTRPLAIWPDGSVRWLELIGLASTPAVAALQREAGIPPAQPAWVRQEGNDLLLGTGGLSLCLAAGGPSPLGWIRLGGRVLTAPSPLTVIARTETVASAGFEAGNRELRIVQAGPIRAEAEVTGWLIATTGERLFHYRLRAAVVAGQSSVSLRLLLAHRTPGVTAHIVRELRLATHWAASEPARHHVYHPHHTVLCRPREVVTALPVELRAGTDHARVFVADVNVLGEEEPWPSFMPDTADHTEPFLGLAVDGYGWVTAAPRDFRELCPKALSIGDRTLALHLQPAWADPLAWLQGRSREFTLDLLFTPDTDPPVTPRLRQLAASCEAAVARVPAAWFRAQRCWGLDLLPPSDPPGPRRFNRFLRKLGTLPTVLGMWDLGDTIDMGYTRTYASNHSTRPLAGRHRPYFHSGNHCPLAEWSGQLTHEPVWANNEYDAILALAREWMREAPSTEHWRRLRWFLRHAIEVDFVSYSDSPLLHHGTPAHSADHQRATAYPSHLWAEGLLAGYCLTGDDDALDTAIRQGDFILRAFAEAKRRDCFWGFNRELGWALLHLAALADLTREPRFHQGTVDLAHALTSQPLDDSLLRQMVQGAFGFVSIALGVQAAFAITAEAPLADWLVRAAEEVGRLVVDEGLECVEPSMVLIYFTTAWQVSGNPAHLRPGLHVLEKLLDSLAWFDPRLEAKPVAMLHRGLGTWLGPAWQHGLLDGLDFRHLSR